MAKLKSPFLIFVAGPNGSGKSTLINVILEHFKKLKMDVPYLCPDDFARKLEIDDPVEKMHVSQQLVYELKNKYVEQGKSFVLESVASHPSHIDFLLKAKLSAYSIATFFVTTENPDINVERVKNRVKNGGHDVPEDKIRSRYAKTMDALINYIDVSDCILVIDNSTSRYMAAFLKNNIGYNAFMKNDYVKKYITEKLDAKDIEYNYYDIKDFEREYPDGSDLINLFNENEN